MQSYRLIPVGDKLVLIIAPNERPLPEGNADYSLVGYSNAGYYDFGIERSSENESFHEVTTSIGGDSHE